MGASAPLIFKGVTPEQYARLMDRATAAGIELSGPSGTASKYGLELAWSYSRETEDLTFQCLRTPFFASAEVVEARIRTLVRESMPESARAEPT